MLSTLAIIRLLMPRRALSAAPPVAHANGNLRFPGRLHNRRQTSARPLICRWSQTGDGRLACRWENGRAGAPEPEPRRATDAVHVTVFKPPYEKRAAGAPDGRRPVRACAEAASTDPGLLQR